MKILFINEIGGLLGGVEQNILLSIDGLTARGHVCHLYCERFSDRGVELFEGICGSVSCLADGISLQDAVDRVSPDVIYVHKITGIDSVLAYKGRIRLVRMIHDHDLYCPRHHKYFFHNRHICRHAAGLICYADLAFLERKPSGAIGFTSIRKKLIEMRRHDEMDMLIVGSRYMREQLILNRFREGQISLLPPAVTFTDQAVSEAEDTGRVLFVGQLIRGKGVDLLLDAMERTVSSVTLDVIGTGNDEQMLRDRVSQSTLRDRVTFHGWMDHETLMRFYDRAMISVVPSRWPEPFGMVGLEAMLRRRPVVAFAVGGIPDWLEDGVTGYLVPEADTQGMAKRIDELASDISLVRTMGEAGWRQVNERFDFSRYIVHLEQILKGEEI